MGYFRDKYFDIAKRRIFLLFKIVSTYHIPFLLEAYIHFILSLQYSGFLRRCAIAIITISSGSIRYKIPKGNLLTRRLLSTPSTIGHVIGDSLTACTLVPLLRDNLFLNLMIETHNIPLLGAFLALRQGEIQRASSQF